MAIIALETKQRDWRSTFLDFETRAISWWRYAAAIILLVSAMIAEAIWPFSGVRYPLLIGSFLLGSSRSARRGSIGWAILCCLGLFASLIYPKPAEATFDWLATILTAGIIVALMLDRLRSIETAKVAADFSEFVDLVPQFLWRARPDGQVDYFNRKYFDITGADPIEAVIKQDWHKHIHPDDLPEFQRTWNYALENSDEVRTLFRVRHHSGDYVWLSGHGIASRDQNGNVNHWYGGLFDVTAHISATHEIQRLASELDEQVRHQSYALTRSNERFQALFEDMNIAYAEQDIRQAKSMIDHAKASGATSFSTLIEDDPGFLDACIATIKTRQVNDALLQMMGYEDCAEHAANLPFQDASDTRRVFRQQLEAMFDERHHFATTATLVGKGGRKIAVAVGINASEDWSVSFSTHIDITSEQRARELAAAARDNLARASRALTVGAVSTSLAHELNQPLLAVNMAAKTAKRWLSKSPPQMEDANLAIDRVTSNTERMNFIIQKTRDRLVKGHREPASVDLRELLGETNELLDAELAGNNINLRLNIEDDAAAVFADRIDLQQVFTNLIINAADAMSDLRGRKSIQITARRIADESVIEVQDNGPGIDSEALQHIFQPFFSTKSGGMGVGLQISRAIVEGYGGTLVAKNNELGGASFYVALPVVDGERRDVAAAAEV